MGKLLQNWRTKIICEMFDDAAHKQPLLEYLNSFNYKYQILGTWYDYLFYKN